MKRGIAAILMAAIAVTSFTAAPPTAYSVSEGTVNELSALSGALQSRYKIGTTVSIPSEKITVAGREYDAQTVVITPDGKAYSADSVTADQLGVYTVEYRAMVDGKLYTDRASFETYNDLYTVTGTGTAEYGKETRYQTNIDGIQVSLHEGDTFTYNEIVDLRELDCETPFIDLFATPNTLGVRDVHTFSMRLTDAYDPDNYVTIDAKSVNSDGGSNLWWMNFIFVAAGPNGNSLKGIEWGKNLVHVDNSFGFPIKYSLYGTVDHKNTVGTNFFQLCYDLAENKLYGPLGKADNYAIDLDDPQYFSNGWRGFTTGEVYLSISGVSYYAPSFNFTIRKIENGDLSQPYVFDREKPEISIECGEVPLAGLNNPYPVFAATASDGYAGKLSVATKVFYNYRGDNRYELPIRDGKFIPAKKGAYTIEYTATDSAGNTAVKTVSVLCDGVDRTLDLTLEALPTGCKTGESVKLATAVVSGGIGTVSIRTAVKYQEKTIDVRNDRFVPQAAGAYDVEVVATDLSGQTVTKTYTVNVALNDRPVIGEARLPDFMVAGCTYAIPTLTAYDYGTGNSSVCAVKVNGQAVTDGVYTVPGDAAGPVEIVYSIDGERKQYSVPVITYASYASLFVSSGEVRDGKDGVVLLSGAFRFANVLSGDFNLRVNVQAGGKLNLTLTDFADGDTAVDLALPAGSHTIAYDAAQGKLTVDGKDAAAAAFGSGLRLKGRVDGTAVIESVNGQNMYGDAEAGAEISVNGYYALKAAYGGKIEVLTANAYHVLKPIGVCNVTVTDPQGNAVIDGKPANETYSVDVTMFGRYRITYTAAGRTVSYEIKAVDRTAPTIIFEGVFPENVKSGCALTVPYATAHDAQDGAVEVQCYVVSPSGMVNPVLRLQESKSEAGIVVRLTEIGVYKIRYFAVDSAGNYAAQEFEIAVTA